MSDTFDDETLAENAAAPAEVEIDGQRVRQHSLREQMEYDKYRKAGQGTAANGFGIKFAKIVPPGTT